MGLRVVVTSGIFPPDVGGPATYVPRVARSLSAEGSEVVVVTTTSGRGARSPEDGVDVYRISRGHPAPLRLAEMSWRVAQLGGNADVIYANGAFLEAVIGARLARKPIVLKVVGDHAWQVATNRRLTTLDVASFQAFSPHSTRLRALRRLQALWCKGASSIIVASQFLARIVAGWGVPGDRIDVIPNAVTIPHGSPRFELGAPADGRIRAVTGGRLLRFKRFDLLLDVAVAMPELSLTIVGDGPDRRRLLGLVVELNLTERVRLEKPVTAAGMADQYRTHDVFVLPSTSESFSYMTIEAMAAGLPVVVSDMGALPEVVNWGEWGEVVSLDPNEWVTTLRALLDDPTRYVDLASRGYAGARSRYDWRIILPRTSALLTQVASSGREIKGP
jgi:glycosyltransferase involved in cell wall biosynthesis